jgi:lipopolysaccharide assembly protein A
MQFWFIVSLLFSLIVATFAVINSEFVTIKFLGLNYELTQSAVILISAVFGAAIAMFLGLYGRIKIGLKVRGLNKELKEAETQIEQLEETIKNHERIASQYAAGKSAGATPGPAPAYTPGIAAPAKDPAAVEQPELAGDE